MQNRNVSLLGLATLYHHPPIYRSFYSYCYQCKITIKEYEVTNMTQYHVMVQTCMFSSVTQEVSDSHHSLSLYGEKCSESEW